MEQSLNAVVEAKIKQKLQKGMVNVQTTMEKLISEGKISRDFTVNVGSEKTGVNSTMSFLPTNPARVTAIIDVPTQGKQAFTFNDHAMTQLAEKLKIPTAYLTALLMGEEWQKTLAYDILNTHNGYLTRNKVLIRAIGDEVRGVLSDSYRRLDSHLIFEEHIKEVFAQGAQLSDGFLDDTIVSVEGMLPAPVEIQTKLNGVIMLAFGSRLSTFDYGGKAQVLSSVITNGVCLNGAVREHMLRTVHLGARLDEGMVFSKETYRLDSLTVASAIRDMTKDIYKIETIKKHLQEIQAASETPVEPSAMLTKLYQGMKLSKGESDEIGRMLMRNDPLQGLQGESTIWKLSQGITAYANMDGVADRRRVELQQVAGDLFKDIKN